MDTIAQTINSITINDIKKRKLNKVYNRMMTMRQEEIEAATRQGKTLLDGRIWLTRVEKFYANKKDILALLTMHYIIDIETYCRAHHCRQRAQCQRELLKDCGTLFDAERRQRIIEASLRKAKCRLLSEIGWVLEKTIDLRTDETLSPIEPIDPTKIFKPSPIITAPSGRIYLPSRLNRNASIQHQRICSNCRIPFSSHITTAHLCPPVAGGAGSGACMGPPPPRQGGAAPFALPAAAAMRMEKKHSSLLKGGTRRKKRKRRYSFRK